MKTRRFILLTAVVAALAIGLVIVMGARLDRVTEEEIVTRFSQRQLLLAEQTAAAIQSVFDKTQQYLLHFKDAPGPTHLADALAMEDEEGIATWQRVTEQGFSSCLRSHPNYTQIRYIDAGGQEIVVVDSDGATVRVVPQDQLRSQAEREFFIATQQLDEGEIYVSRLEPALGHGEVGAGLLGVRLATPVFDSQGQRQGIVVINLLADEIRAHIARLTAEEGVDAWVLDERGVEIINVAHPELEGSNTYEYCRQTGDETLMAMVEDMQAGRRGTTTYLWPESAGGPLAVKRLAAYVPIFPAEGQVWSVGTSVPYDTVLAAHRQTHTVLLLLGGSITLIVLIAAILAAQSHRKQAVAETRIRLNEVLSRRVEELAFLNETAHTLTSSLDQQEILTSLLHRATVTLKAEIGSVCLREEDGHLRFAVAVGSHAEQIQGQRLPSDEGVVGWCIREGQPILVPDVREDTRFYSGVDKESGFVTRSILCLPLRVRDETIGALEILNKAGGFDQDDLQLMESVTAQAAIAIQNARLYEQAQEEIAERKRAEEEIKRRGEELEALREISLAISAQLELDTLLQDIVEQGCRLLKVTSGGVHLVDEMSSGLQMVVSHGYTRDYTGTRLAPGEGIAGKVLQSGAPLTVDDYHHWEGQSPGWEAEPITAVLSMPLKHGEQVTGVLNFSEIARARSFDEHDLWLATLFAGQAAIAIENAWLYQAEQSARERADTLRETSRVVGSTLELDDVLSLVLRQTKRVLTYDTASILLFAADEPAMAAVAGYEDEELVKTEVPLRLGDSPILQAMACDRLPIVIADVREDERWIWVPGADEIRAWIGVPLLVRDEMIGALMVDSTQPGSYNAADGAIAQAMANQAAVAIENARLYEQAQHRLESLANLNRVSQAIASSLDVKDILEQIVGLAGSVVNSDYASVVLLDEKGEPTLGAEDFRGVSPVTWRIRRSGGITRHVLDSGQPVVVDTISDEGTMSPPLRRPDGELIEANPDIVAAGIRSFAAVPIQAKEKMLGVVFAHSRQPRAFREQIPLLTTFANQAAVAIENARLYEETRRHVEELTVLHNIDVAITSTLNPDEVLNLIARQAAELMGAETIAIPLLNEDGTHLTYATVHGRLAADLTGRVKPLRDTGICTWVLRNKQGFYSADLAADERETEEIREALGVQTVISAPMIFKGEIIGAITAINRRDGGIFTRADLEECLRPLANQAAIAIENARLFEAAQRRSAELQALYHTSLRLGTQLETFEELLHLIVEQAVALVGAEMGGIYLYDPQHDKLTLSVAVGYFTEFAGQTLKPGEGLAGKVFTSRRPLATENYRTWPGRAAIYEGESHFKTMLGVPLLGAEGVLGVLDIGGGEHKQAFDEHDVWLAELFAAQAAVAIENARLFQAEQEQRELAEALEEAAAAVSSTLDADQVLDSILEQVERVVTGDTFNITLVEGDIGRIVRCRGRSQSGTKDQISHPAITIAEYPNLVKMMQTGEPVLITDTASDPNWVPSKDWDWRRSYVAAPIQAGGVTMGFLNVSGARTGQFDAADARRLEAFADHAATAIKNARLFEAEQRRAGEIKALAEVSRAVSSTLDLDQVLESIATHATTLSHSDEGGIFELDEVKGVLRIIASYNASEEFVRAVNEADIRVGEAAIGRAAATKSPVQMADTGAEARYRYHETSAIDSVRSVLAVPMLKGEKSLGGIVVWRRKPGPFSSQDVALLTALADHAAVAVENAHLFEAERLRRQEAETLRQTALALTTSLDRNQVIERILIQLRQVVPYDSASVQLLRGDRLEIVGGHGFPNLLDLLGFSFSVDGDNPNSEVVRTRAPFIVADGPAVHEKFRREPHAQAGIRSWLGVPMLVGEQLVGMIALDKREPGFYTEEHAQLALAFAAQAAIAFENARLYEETTAHTGQLASLLETSQALTSVLDLNEVLVRIGNQARALLTAEGCTIYFLEPDGETLRPVIALESYAEEVLVTPLSIYDSFNGLAVRSGQGQIFNYTGSDSRGAQIPGTPEEEECLMCIPLISKGQVIGTMSLDRPGRHAFNLEDLDLATTFASHAAIAIENARLYEETHRRAERLAVINRTARAASGTLHLDDLMETVYQEVAPLFQTDAFFIALYDEETNELDFRIRVDKGVREPPERQPVGSGLTGFVVTEKRPLLIRNLDEEQDRLPPAQPWGTMKAPPSWLGVPMQIGDRVVGVICVQAYRPHAYGEEEQVLLSIIADQVAVAVENARLFEAEQDQRELAEALEKAAAAVSSTLEFDQVLDRILEQAERIVAGDASNVMLVEDDVARPVRWRGYERFGAAGFPSTLALSISETLNLQEMVETRKAMIIPDTATYPGWAHTPEREWLRSYVAAPIQVGSVTVGFLNVDGTQPGQFDLADARRLEALAAHAATAIENAGLYQELRNHAGQLEQRVQERTAQLEAQYARLDAILRSATDGIIVTNAGGEIVQTNPVAQTWLTKTLSPEDAAHLRETARDLAQRAEERPETVLELTGLDLQLNAAPVSEPGMEEATAVVGIHDVSHLKALDRMKSRFVSNVSHELRTPVTTIKLYTYLMQKRPDKWEQYMDALEQTANQQAQLVEDILQVSRIDAGRLEMKLEPTALNELTEMTVGNQQRMAQEQGLTLEHRPAEPGPVALIDSRQIMQVLCNLVTNAIHYTSEGGRVIVSTGKEQVEDRTWATVTVADTGIGIPEKELPHIFERFFRGEEPQLMQSPGTGLGLAIVNEIVELHGGRVTVESKVGEGSTFTVWLPLAD